MSLVQRILVATDFSRASRLAVTRAAHLAAEHHADLRLIHAKPDWALFSRWTSARREHHDAVSSAAEAALRAEIQRIRNDVGIDSHGEVLTGKASLVIAQAAQAYGPDLVIAGARGEHQPQISPESFGGTTLKLLLHTRYPLLLVRGWDERPYRISIAAVHDVCATSKRVVLWGSTLVGPGDCHILHAYEAPYLERTRAAGVSELEINECALTTWGVAQRIAAELATQAASAAHIHCHTVRGNPLGVMVTAIAHHQPTLVVLGRSEADDTEPLGTEGLRMAYHCPVDTLVV